MNGQDARLVLEAYDSVNMALEATTDAFASVGRIRDEKLRSAARAWAALARARLRLVLSHLKPLAQQASQSEEYRESVADWWAGIDAPEADDVYTTEEAS